MSSQTLCEVVSRTCSQHMDNGATGGTGQDTWILEHIKGILPKGPYLPCVSMAGRALLAGYHRSENNYQKTGWSINSDLGIYSGICHSSKIFAKLHEHPWPKMDFSNTFYHMIFQYEISVMISVTLVTHYMASVMWTALASIQACTMSRGWHNGLE